MGIEPTNLLHAMQALYQLSYAPRWSFYRSSRTEATVSAGPSLPPAAQARTAPP